MIPSVFFHSNSTYEDDEENAESKDEGDNRNSIGPFFVEDSLEHLLGDYA